LNPLDVNSLIEVDGPWSELGLFDLRSICDDLNGCNILLAAQQTKRMQNYLIRPYGYRLFDSASLQCYISSINVGVYSTSKSDFLAWAMQASVPSYFPSAVQHYIVASENGILEYIGPEEPILHCI
jgi:hypothetical protein